MQRATLLMLLSVTCIRSLSAQLMDSLSEYIPTDTVSEILTLAPDTSSADSLSIVSGDSTIAVDTNVVALEVQPVVPLEVVFLEWVASSGPSPWLRPWQSDCRHGCGVGTQCFFLPELPPSPTCGHYTDLPDTDSETTFLHSAEENITSADPNHLSSEQAAEHEKEPSIPLLPEQPWWQAVLPNAIRLRKS